MSAAACAQTAVIAIPRLKTFAARGLRHLPTVRHSFNERTLLQDAPAPLGFLMVEHEPSDDASDGGLFGAMCLPRQPAPDWGRDHIARYLRMTSKKMCVLERGGSHAAALTTGETQQAFDFSSDKNVVGCIPRTRYVYLDRGVYDTFRDIVLLRRPSLALENCGIGLIGQLVLLSECELRQRIAIDPPTLDAMKRQLNRVNFSFNMRAPGWSPYHRS